MYECFSEDNNSDNNACRTFYTWLIGDWRLWVNSSQHGQFKCKAEVICCDIASYIGYNLSSLNVCKTILWNAEKCRWVFNCSLIYKLLVLCRIKARFFVMGMPMTLGDLALVFSFTKKHSFSFFIIQNDSCYSKEKT